LILLILSILPAAIDRRDRAQPGCGGRVPDDHDHGHQVAGHPQTGTIGHDKGDGSLCVLTMTTTIMVPGMIVFSTCNPENFDRWNK
jgi:hypothetical protein